MNFRYHPGRLFIIPDNIYEQLSYTEKKDKTRKPKCIAPEYGILGM